MRDNPLFPDVIPLRCPSTHHAWGVAGAASPVARLHALNNRTYISSSMPYAEFIVSSHDPHNALLDGNAIDDSDEAETRSADAVGTTTTTLGAHVHAQVIEVDPNFVPFYTQLHEDGVPYILKLCAVASFPTGLSVHPAATLSPAPVVTTTPAHIGGDNDDDSSVRPRFQRPFAKPLLLLAVSRVRLLSGFNPAAKIVAQLSRVPEFADAVGRPTTDAFVHVVKSAVPTAAHVRSLTHSLLLGQDGVAVGECVQRAVERLAAMPDTTVTDDDRCFMAFAKQFPSDAVCFFAYLLTSVTLEAGEVMYVEPGQPYCIFNGTFVEASSKSDAVFYAGLTSSEDRDVEGFLNTAKFATAANKVFPGESIAKYGTVYTPPVADFQLTVFDLPKATTQTLLDTIAPTIVLVLEGEGHLSLAGGDVLLPLHTGSVYYLNPQQRYLIANREDDDAHPMQIVQIGVNESAAPMLSSSCSLM